MTTREATRQTLRTNIGTEVNVPVEVKEDFAYFTLGSDGIKSYYDENGYVVIRGLIPTEIIDSANTSFDNEVLHSERFIYRQATADPERHAYTESGFMLNSILNPHSMDPRFFHSFRSGAEHVFTDENMQLALQLLFGAPAKQVQGMYFHGNPSTWPHQDTYYLDSEHIGAMTAAWISCEDIAPGAGRFFICPGSHHIDMKRNGGDFDIAFHHGRYKQLVNDIIRSKNLEWRAPALAKGDVLFWNAKTIHGSLPTSQPERSRRSFTAHYIPKSHNFLQFQSRVLTLEFSTVNGMQVYRPKDQAKAINRAVLFVETRFPRVFKVAKKIAIKLATAQ